MNLRQIHRDKAAVNTRFTLLLYIPLAKAQEMCRCTLLTS